MRTEQTETMTKTVVGSPVSAPNIAIYADGSSLRNGSPDAQSGAGAVLIDRERNHIKLKACYLGALTNQQAEIMACTIGLEDLKSPSRVEIFSDSKYVIDTMLSLNRMKANRPYWNRLVKACYRHHITWNWVRGHSGNVFQETADRLSRAAAIAKANLEKDTLERLGSLLKGTPDQKTISMIHNGIKAVATVCDGAQKLDGQGFNKLDSSIGHGFAEKKHLDPSEAIAARKLLATYRGQIAVIDGQLVLLL